MTITDTKYPKTYNFSPNPDKRSTLLNHWNDTRIIQAVPEMDF